jgi:putative membrane protein
MKTSHPLFVAASAVVAIAAGCASAGKEAPAPDAPRPAQAAAAPEAPPAPPPPPPEPRMEPAEFLRWADAQCALQGQVAARVVAAGENPKAKDYARRIVANHAAMDVIVRKVAKAQGAAIDAQPAPAPDAEATAARFRDLSGLALDKAWVEYMAESQQQALVAYRWQYDNCKDDAVRAFASQTLPIVGMHQRIGDELHKELNKEEIRLAAERKAAEEKAAEEKRIADAMAEAKRTAKKQPPQRKSMLRQPPPKPEPEEAPAAEGAGAPK